MKERDGARALVRDSHATPAVFAKSAEAIEKKRVSLRETASRAAVARDKKERSKSAQPIEKKLDENCTKGAKSEKEDSVEDGKAFGERGKRPDMGV